MGGLMGEGVMWTEFQFCKIRKGPCVGGDGGCTATPHPMSWSCILDRGQEGELYWYVYFTN